MAVEGKTILQTPERTELTGKEGIPFQEGERNGHVLLERINEYVSGNVVYILPGALETTKDWSTTDVESIVGNWDEFVEAVNHKVVIAKVSIGYDGIIAYIPAGIVKLDGFIGFYINAGNGIFVYSISSDRISLETLVVVPNVINNLNSDNEESALSAAQGKVLNDKIAEISNPASADKDGLMSKEDKKTFDSIRFSEDENSILFGEKKYGVHVFKNLQRLSASSSSDDVKKALNIDSPQDLESLISKGLNFVSVDTESTDKNLCPCSVRYATPNIISITYCSAYSSNILTVHISVLSGSSSSFRVDGIEDPINSIPSVNNTLTSTSASEALSASMGKKLQDEKLAKTDVVNNLTTTDADKALSAAQGKVLKGLVDNLVNKPSNYLVDFTSLTSKSTPQDADTILKRYIPNASDFKEAVLNDRIAIMIDIKKIHESYPDGNQVLILRQMDTGTFSDSVFSTVRFSGVYYYGNTLNWCLVRMSGNIKGNDYTLGEFSWDF